MPEFVLPMGDEDASKRFHALDEFTQGYIQAMFFTDASDPDDGDLQDATVYDLAPETWQRILADCASFENEAAGTRTALELSGAEWDAGHAGRDFWYTRNGHGCGFWDGDWPEPYAAALTKIAKKFGSVDLYRGDDGKVYLM